MTSSSDSSSNETAIEIAHESPKDGSAYGYNKHPKKSTDAKHALMERPVKCRKTDSILSAKVAYHHTDAQPRKASGQFGTLGKSGKYMGYSHKKFTIPGGAQRSRANRALNREATKSLGSPSAPMASNPGWGKAPPDLGDRGLNSLKRPWDDSNDLSGARTIRRISLPALAVAKPLAALCARPSPNVFARTAWAASPFNDNDPTDEDFLMETSSDLTDLTEPEHSPAPKSSPDSAFPPVVNPDQSGQKRKREPVATDRKKMGRAFYMKDEKKRMPKGWVLVTDSSEETGEDEDSAAAPKSDEPSSGTKPPPQAIGVNQAADSPGLDSGSGATPSLVHTPSSRATSTPTQSSGTLVDDQATTPVVAQRVLVTYSLRKSVTACTATTLQSPKRRKLNDEIDTSPSQHTIRHISVNQESVRDSEGYDRSHDQAENTGLKPDVSVDDSSRDSSALLTPKSSSVDHDAHKEVLSEHKVSLLCHTLVK
jgi:hypothetical protein